MVNECFFKIPFFSLIVENVEESCEEQLITSLFLMIKVQLINRNIKDYYCDLIDMLQFELRWQRNANTYELLFSDSNIYFAQKYILICSVSF